MSVTLRSPDGRLVEGVDSPVVRVQLMAQGYVEVEPEPEPEPFVLADHAFVDLSDGEADEG